MACKVDGAMYLRCRLTQTMATRIYAVYITESGVLKATTEKYNMVLTLNGPFSRIAQKTAGLPVTLKTAEGLVEVVDIEESSVLISRTIAFLRALPVVAR